MGRGYFFSVEGIEGAGKSTLIKSLKASLESLGYGVTSIREPGGTKAGDRIRALLLDPDVSLTPKAELLLFNASRAQLVESVVIPAVEAGKLVLCDRYADSSIAYQGAARGISQGFLAGALELGTLGVWPHRTLLVDLSPEVGLARARERRGDNRDDRFEGEALAFHKRVREGFLARAEEQAERFIILKGEASPESLAAQALDALLASMGHQGGSKS